MINDDMNFQEDLFGELEEKPTRNGYGHGVVEAGKENEDVVVLCCDLTKSTRSHFFKQEFPDRFVEVGVAEQNMAGLAAGMSFAGKIPYISSYAVFNPGINWSQIRVAICYSQANVKIMGAHAGVSVGPDGATHQALEDIALTRVLPNMTVVVPCDFHQAKKAARELAGIDGPCYMRFARASTPIFTTEETPFEVGKAQTFRHGDDVTIIGAGPVIYKALKAANELEDEGINARVLNLHTVKPIDEDAVLAAAEETGAIVSVEEHQVNGGIGSAVAEVLSGTNPTPQEFVGVPDRFGESGDPEEVLEEVGLTSDNIASAARNVLERK